MKLFQIVISSLLLACLATAGTPEIEVEVRFIEIGDTCSAPSTLSWQLDGAGATVLSATDTSAFLAALAQSGNVDLLSAPRLRMQSGTNSTIKVVTEYQYATDVDVRVVSVTNDERVVSGVACVPSKWVTRDVGVTLSVTPVFDAKRNMIDLEVMAEIVSEPIWKEYVASFEGPGGQKQNVNIAQPFFHICRINPTLSIRNGETVAMGGMITTRTRRIEDRVPVLGAIPWLGRLFRSSHEVSEKRNLIISISARTVGQKP